MAVEPQVQQFIDFIRDEMPRRIKTNPNNLPDAQKLLVSVSGTLEVIYKTLAELDIAIKSDVDTALSSKEPTITAGTSSQYYRGDKTFQPLNTNAVTESTDKRYLSDAQKTIATQAATSTLSGYLSSADWNTFNGKQAALVSGTNIKTINGASVLGTGDLTTGATFTEIDANGSTTVVPSLSPPHLLPVYLLTNTGSSTHVFNLNIAAGAIVENLAGVTLNVSFFNDFVSGITAPDGTVSGGSTYTTELYPNEVISARVYSLSPKKLILRKYAGANTDEAFYVRKPNTGLDIINAKWDLTALTQSRTHTYPNKDINFGDLPSVATTDENNLSGTRTRILGGRGTTMSGTDVVAIGLHYSTFTTFAQGTICLGSSLHATNPLTPAETPFSAALGTITCLHTKRTGSATANITLDGNSEATAANCIRAVNHATAFGAATHTIEFIITVGNEDLAYLVPRRYVYATRKVFVSSTESGGITSATITLGTDQSLGDAATSTVTVGVTVDAGLNILIPTVSFTASGNQSLYQASVRIESHYNRKSA